MADQDVRFKILVDDAAARTELRAFGSEAERVLGIEKDLAVAGKTIGRETALGVAGGTSAMALYKRAVGGGTMSLSEMKAATQALNREMDNAATPEDRARFAALAREVEQTEQATRKAATAFGTAGSEIAAGMGAASRSVGGFGRVAEVALGMSVGQVAVAGLDRFRQGVAGAVGVGVTLEQQLADLSAITGITGTDLDALGQAARAAAVESGIGAAEQTEAMKLLASNISVASMGGISGLQAMGREVVTLSAAAGTDLATAANATAGAINQFGLEADQASRIVNLLSAGAKEGGAELPDLSESLRVAGAAAAGAGVSVEQTVGALEILSQSMIKGSDAGTTFKGTLGILLKETDKFAAAGLGTINLQANGLSATLRQLRPLLQDQGKLIEIFGTDNQVAAQYLIQNVDALDSMTEAVTGTNTAQGMAETQMNTLRGSVTLLKTALEEIALNGYEGLGGAARDTVVALREAVVWLDDNWESVETGTKLLALGALAYGAYRAGALLSAAATAAHGAAVTAAGMASLMMAGETGAATLALRGFTAAIASNPLGLLLVALSTAIGAWLLFGDGAERAAQRTETAMNRVRSAADQAKAAILAMDQAGATAARRSADTEQADALTRMNDLWRQILEKRRALGDLSGRLASDNPLAAATAGREASALGAEIAGLESDLEIARSQLQAAGEKVQTARDRLRALASSAATPPPAATPAASSGSAPPPRVASGPTPAQQAEEARQAALGLAQTNREIDVTEAGDREEAARHRRALRVQDLRDTHADNAERIALMTDEFAKRRAALSNDANLAEATRTVEIEGIRAEAQAAEDAAKAKLDAEIARIDGERAAEAHNADETARIQLARDEFDKATDAARNRRDEEVGRVRLERRAQEQSDAEEARQIDADELARDLARINETADAEHAAREAARRDRREYDQEQEEAHRKQMARLQEQADAVLAAVGLAAQVTANSYAHQEAEAQALHDADTRRRDAAQQAALDAVQARLDAENLSADERKTLETETATLRQTQAASNAAADLAYRKKSAEADRKAAVAFRKTKLFEIAIQTALNIVAAGLNPFKIAAAALVGATQAAAVAGQPLPPVPQYALGTDRAPGGVALVGERGPELVHLPGGSSVITNARTEALGAAMRAVERATGGGGGGRPSQIVVHQAPDPAHAAAVAEQTRRIDRQTRELRGGLASVEAAVKSQNLRIDGLELSRGIRAIEAREEAAGNTRER